MRARCVGELRKGYPAPPPTGCCTGRRSRAESGGPSRQFNDVPTIIEASQKQRGGERGEGSREETCLIWTPLAGARPRCGRAVGCSCWASQEHRRVVKGSTNVRIKQSTRARPGDHRQHTPAASAHLGRADGATPPSRWPPPLPWRWPFCMRRSVRGQTLSVVMLFRSFRNYWRFCRILPTAAACP